MVSPTLADVPLETRCQGAIAVIWLDPELGVRKRRELLAAALWPNPARTPSSTPVPPVEAQVQAPRKRPEPLSRRRWAVEPPATPEQRAEARRLLAAGWPISQIAEHMGQPWSAVHGWIRAKHR